MTEWTAPPVSRPEPELVTPEREALEAWLDYHRDTLLWKCAGLTNEQLKRRAVPPSRLSLLGLVRHMTEVERWWFRIQANDDDLSYPYASETDWSASFESLEGADAEADLENYRNEVGTAREVMRGKQLDDVVSSHGHHPAQPRDVRWLYIHMIEEYARHNGHADLIRECIDGVTGD